MLASVGLVVSTTLAGSRRKLAGLENCTSGEWFPECALMDAAVGPVDLKRPWVVFFAAFVLCSAPTILLRCRYQVTGLLTLCVVALGALGLMLFQRSVPHRSVAYAVALHGSVTVLGSVPVGRWFACPEVWLLRHAAIGVILFLALEGPSLAVVQWPGETGSVTCAALAHLIGALGSDLVVRALWVASDCLHSLTNE